MEFVSIQCTINKMSITCMSLRLRSATELSYLAERSISNHGHSSKWTITEQSPCFCPQLSEGSPQEIGKTRTFIPKCWIYITSDIKEPTGFPRKISISGHIASTSCPSGRPGAQRPSTDYKNYYFLLNRGTEEQASPYMILLATSWILATAIR